MTRHEFLAELHRRLQPRGYLEIGVQSGASLHLADCPAIGVDPQPLPSAYGHPQSAIYVTTSDDFFARLRADRIRLGHFDLAFVDGMHLVEFALRDFMGVERVANPRTVVAFDDMLPRNQHEALRDRNPGDWTGDVWKVHPILARHRPELQWLLVDTFPTGILLVWGLDPANTVLTDRYDEIIQTATPDQPVPADILTRAFATKPEAALDIITGWRTW